MDCHRHVGRIQYIVGILVVGVLYYLLAIAFAGHMQGLADSHVRSVPWYYDIPGFFLVFPFFGLVTSHFQYFRPIFVPFETVFGSADNAALYIIISLQGAFWGFVGVFCFRFLGRLLVRRGCASSTYQPDEPNADTTPRRLS